MITTRPVIRYPGGKFTIAPWIIQHFPAHSIYVEPYGGGASVLMAKPRSKAEIYNDINSDVVNIFRILRDPEQAKELQRLCDLTPYAFEEYREAYEPTDDPIEKARRMIFRSFAGIGSDSAFRYNGYRSRFKDSKSKLTDAHSWATWPRSVPCFVDRLKAVCIENRPALDIFKMYDHLETLFYVDPPYLGSIRERNLYPNELHSDDDHSSLAGILSNLKGSVIISGYRSDLYDTLFKGWKCYERSAKAQNGLARVECIWMNSAAGTPRLF